MTSSPPKNLIPTDPSYLIIMYRESTKWDCLQITRCLQPLGLGSAVACDGFNNWVCGLLLLSVPLRHGSPSNPPASAMGNWLLLTARFFLSNTRVRREYLNEGGKGSLNILSKPQMGALKTQLKSTFFYSHLSWKVSLNSNYGWHNPR